MPVVGEDGKLVPPLVDGVCFFCRILPKLRKDLQAVVKFP